MQPRLGRYELLKRLAGGGMGEVYLARQRGPAGFEKLLVIKTRADTLEATKMLHQKQGDRFQYAFVVLQAGVVLSTIAASARRKQLWVAAILCGVAGLAMVANSYLLYV